MDEKKEASKLLGVDLNNNNDYKKSKPDYNSKAPEGYIRLYHNTPSENLESIYQHGLVTARPGGPRERKAGYTDAAEGDTIWATTKPGDGYGGNTIAFDVPLTHKMQKVNDDEYILFEDVKPENFRFVDRPVSKLDHYRISDLPKFINKNAKSVEEAKEMFKKAFYSRDDFEKQPRGTFLKNEYLNIPEEELDYWIEQYWGVNKPQRSEILKTYMKNMGYTDDDVVVEDDKEIVFGSRPQYGESYQQVYDKKNDKYNITGSYRTGKAEDFNKKYDNSLIIHKNYLSNLKYPISNESDCYYAYQELLQNYVDGIMRKSKGHKDPFIAREIAKDVIGPFERFKKSAQDFYKIK